MQGEPSIMVPSYQEESHSSPPHSISTQENTEADFFSRHRLQRWDFKLALSECWRICQRLHVWPRLEGVLEQQIEVILICLGWKGAMWWLQLVKLRTEMSLILLLFLLLSPQNHRAATSCLQYHYCPQWVGSGCRLYHLLCFN